MLSETKQPQCQVTHPWPLASVSRAGGQVGGWVVLCWWQRWGGRGGVQTRCRPPPPPPGGRHGPCTVSKAFVSTQAPRRERALRAHTRPQHCRLQRAEQRRLFSWV